MKKSDQLNLFEMDDISSIDELFINTDKYRESKEYMDLMLFISKFRRYSPYNCMLMHIQDPTVSYVASIRDWKSKFNRYPKKGARPLVILQPFGPVMFLYDIEDTVGEAIPEEVLNPFRTEGTFPSKAYNNILNNSKFNGILIDFELLKVTHAGNAKRIRTNSMDDYKVKNPVVKNNYSITINSNLNKTDQFSTLIHELAHIFCGHLGMDPVGWWDDRSHCSNQIAEIEAETVSYLICKRLGLHTTSEKYLVDYKGKNTTIPEVSLNTIFQCVDYIEKMGQTLWKKPLKKPKKSRVFKSQF